VTREGSQIFHDGRVTLYAGDCLAVLDRLEPNSVDAVCSDPPYHLASIVKRFGGENAAPAKDYSGEKPGATPYARASRGFMGKEWDGGDVAFRAETWAKTLRVLKPGGHLVAFSAPKCVHRMVCAIEDAGFEIRDSILNLLSHEIMASAFFDSLSIIQQDALLALLAQHEPLGDLFWSFGTGFPKSLDVSKMLDKDAGHWRGRAGAARIAEQRAKGTEYQRAKKGDPITAAAAAWEGWGTALKPAFEPICLARKPLSEKSVAANVLRWGTGAINIDATRIVGGGDVKPRGSSKLDTNMQEGWARPWMENRDEVASSYDEAIAKANDLGRWPANVCHDGSDEVVGMFLQSGGQLATVGPQYGQKQSINCYGDFGPRPRGDSGSAARFFYSAKADANDRLFSKHPTVKPVDLMRWLVRMVTPPRGTVLDPFAGTGTTGHAALLEGFNAVLIEREPEYLSDIERRITLVFAGEIERAAHGPKKEASDLPLFGGNETGGGKSSRLVYGKFARDEQSDRSD